LYNSEADPEFRKRGGQMGGPNPNFRKILVNFKHFSPKGEGVPSGSALIVLYIFVENVKGGKIKNTYFAL
jgi:hypothetical protein